MTSSSDSTDNDKIDAWQNGFLPFVSIIREQSAILFQNLLPAQRNEALAKVAAIVMIGYLGHLEAREPDAFDAAGRTISAAQFILDGALPNGRVTEISVRLAKERRRRRKAEKRLNAADIEMEAARRIQQKLLPSAPPVLPGFDIAGITRPADATGGDYFDYVPMLDDCVGVVVGDVSGHGFGPALVIASARAYLRAFARTHNDLGELLSLVNRVLTVDMEIDRFVTVALARLDARKRTLVYASAGHPTGYILDAAGIVRLHLPSTGPLLGCGFNGNYFESPLIPLEPNDLVLLLSDGVTESFAPDSAAFGSDRAVNIVGAYRQEAAAQIVFNLYHAVRAFCQNAPQQDDITAVVIKVGERTTVSHG